jgi:rubrerythrin
LEAIMLIKFRSKATPEVLMYQEHAKPILDLLNKDVERGVITAAEAPKAVEIIEHQIAEMRKRETQDESPQDPKARHEREDNDRSGAAAPVGFATRAYPLLEMLRDARDHKADVMWGVL